MAENDDEARMMKQRRLYVTMRIVEVQKELEALKAEKKKLQDALGAPEKK